MHMKFINVKSGLLIGDRTVYNKKITQLQRELSPEDTISKIGGANLLVGSSLCDAELLFSLIYKLYMPGITIDF
jgi:hypothetical protein